MKVNLDVRKHPVGHQFTVVKCDKCGVFYEPYGKEHKCKKSNKLRGPVIMNYCYVYIVRCSDGTYYTGWTNNLTNRINTHNSGSGAKYTRSRRPVTLVYYEKYLNRSEAMKRECAIKRMTRAEKENLIKEGNQGVIVNS